MPQVDDTPLMQQWREVKSQHQDALVFFRVGDFFELFYGDAEEGSRILGLTLTSRNNGAAARVPLAGVPAKALDEYLGRLVAHGCRVAICDQVEDPADAKGIVRREVVETVTPGTILHDALLSSRRNNFLVSVIPDESRVGIATLDLSTGELVLNEADLDDLLDELGRLEPSELLLPRSLEENEPAVNGGSSSPTPVRTFREDWTFDHGSARETLLRHYGVQSLEGFGFQEADQLLIRAAGGLLAYVDEIRPAGVKHLRPPAIRREGSTMLLDDMTRRNLELVESLRPVGDDATVLAVLDQSVTPMGGRLLRRWLLEPLIEAAAIWARQEAVAEFHDDPVLRNAVREALGRVSDLGRLAGKIGTGRVMPRDLVGLLRSLVVLPDIIAELERVASAQLTEARDVLDPMDDVKELVEAAIDPDAPAALQDGGVIRAGYHPELDELRAARDGARDFIAALQTRERKRTGIGSLKVGFNKVFGYYLEVTKTHLARVPDDYVRKQTLTNAERYFTPELKEWEERVFGAEDRIANLESELFREVRSKIAGEVARIQDTGAGIALLDVLGSLAEVAQGNAYVRPDVHTGFDVEVVAGRHPVVETMMPRSEFIPNDLTLDEGGRIVILTGPNMAGKSTVLRQVGLIQLLAQMGGFVPADRARLPVCDRVFTRVGASDNLARGQSTFMVEMNETAAILHEATDRSLVLLDEIGRGTSTYDGVSIAWSVTEHLHEEVGCKTVFATHYHELTQLGDLLPAVKNLNVAVREVGEKIVFLRRLESGGADRSYGIQVARLAGVPEDVIERAKELLTELEGTHTGGGEGLGRHRAHRPASEAPPDQLSLFHGSHPIVERLRRLDPEELTPMQALTLLAQLVDDAGGKGTA